ncbi:MAG: poly[(R)-3-hydroxyalkanoate] polymerase subunit PhaC [Alphaproteobacteria bacterium]|nr:poly[(R)-3-hydroxyalkanoate] polymerase subunit PhaC [Alphaproteobacteria bacterium]
MRAPSDPAKGGSPDVEEFARNVARIMEEGGRAMAAYLKPREEGHVEDQYDEVNDVVKTLGQVAEYWLRDPQRALELQSSLGKAYLDLWANAVKRMAGEPVPPVAEPDPRDKRFADPEWSTNQFFDFLKQGYLLTVQWANRLVRDAEGLDPHTQQKADFYMRQIANAIAPSNFVLTNPELLRETLSSNAENLVRGMHMLAEDIQAGKGNLKIRQSDVAGFEVGRNLALTPGKVIFENALMQLIQYAPTTDTVLERPLLIVPPWINKFYILDLTPEKSFIRWCVAQGVTVFVVSWVNPDSNLAEKSFEDYMRDGPLAALDAIGQATGARQVNTIGYCVGGTLLATTLAYMASKGDERIASATFFAAQVDFTHAGDLKVFVDEAQIAAREREMDERGYLEGKKMANAFNLLRSNDLIWPYVINNYLKGKEPAPFDLLYWNADATRMPKANHSFYLRNCYLENRLSKGDMVVGGKKLDLKSVKVPIYNLAAREDHIAPARSVMLGSKFFGGPVRFVLAGSGHIAGVVNPPDKMKYQYWTGPRPSSANLDAWLARAKEHAGSWWPDWFDWIKKQDPAEVPARTPGGGKVIPIEDAPGSYVKVRD